MNAACAESSSSPGSRDEAILSRIVNGWKRFIHPLFEEQFRRPSSRAGWNRRRAVIYLPGREVLEGSLPRAGLGVGSGLGRDALKLGCSPSGNFARGPRGLRRLSNWSRTMKWNVVSADSISPLELAVRFEDGTEGNVRFESSPLSSRHEALKNPEVFQQARVESGELTWPGEPDLAPDAICREIKRPGEWRLR